MFPTVRLKPGFLTWLASFDMPEPDTTTHRMQCMEVWGGNQFVNSAVALSGLDAWVYSSPHRVGAQESISAVGGGDVHFVSSCASGRITRLLVADVSGHGGGVHDVALQLRSIMRRYVNYISPSKFMSAMNDRFASLTQDGCFATAIVATYFTPTRMLTLCNAGHPAPLLYRRANATWSLLQPSEQDPSEHSELPLGVVNNTTYRPFCVSLSRGDLVLCYSDSLIEARGKAGELLGTAGLLDLVRTLDAAEPHRIIPRLIATLGNLSPDNLGHDDVTTLLFTPNNQRTGWRDNLLAPIRVVRGWLQGAISGSRLA